MYKGILGSSIIKLEIIVEQSALFCFVSAIRHLLNEMERWYNLWQMYVYIFSLNSISFL